MIWIDRRWEGARSKGPLNKIIRLVGINLLFTSSLLAADPDLPQPMDFRFADELVAHSPFTRPVDLQATLQLTGIAYVDGHPVATVLNTETKERLVVSEQPNAQGWRLMSTSTGDDLWQTEVEMQVGTEIIAMHYQGSQTSPISAGKSPKSLMAGPGKKGDSKIRTSSFLGDHGKELYSSLSPEGRDKFKDIMRSRVESHPELTPEQNADYARKVFAKIKANDTPGLGVSPKSAKPPKKKQGA